VKALVIRVRERLRTSLALWPGVCAALAFTLAKLVVLLDRDVSGLDGAWFLYGGGPESARELLSTVASSILTFTALVFSITIVALQLASSQFSPRVLNTFLEDRQTKAAMALFVGTFVFALAVLQEVRGTNGGGGFVPGISVYVAFVLVLASVGVFIHFIHHMAHSVRAVSIVKRVGDATRASIDRMYPEGLLEGAGAPPLAPAGPPAALVRHQGRCGVLASVDEAELMKRAEQLGGVIALVPRPGEFVPNGAPLFRVWSAQADVDAAGLRDAALIQHERTVHQDPAAGFRQLVDVAERALSPGVNDPSTAVLVLDELHDLLRSLARRHLPSPQRLDSRGALRLVLPAPGWEDYVHLALDEIRRYGGGSLQVARRLRALLDDVASVAGPSRLAALDEQRRLLDEATRREMPSRAERSIALRPSA